MFTQNPVTYVRFVGLIEAVSFLLLLFVAMPLKYLAGIPLAVKVAGWFHGVLFMLLGVGLLRAMFEAKWPFKRALTVFIAALLPFGPFVIDRRMKEWERTADIST